MSESTGTPDPTPDPTPGAAAGDPASPPPAPGYWEQQAGQQPAGPPPYPTPGQAPPNPYGGPTPTAQPGWYPAAGTPAFPVYVRPDLPKATAAMVIGIVALAGTFTCLLPILASPVAWVLGAQARRQIRESPQQWGGEGKATAGMVLGIIGTVLLLLAVIGLVVLIVVAINDPGSFDSGTGV